MATLQYKCMHCGWIGHSSEIKVDENGASLCPSCGDEDVFPQRYFCCLTCGFQAEQYDFFPELPADEDPERNLEGDSFIIPVHHDRPSDGEDCESYAWIQVR